MASQDSRSSFWPVVTCIVAVICLLVSLPDSWKGWAPSFLKPSLHLGLDLAGGTQLDFRISEDEINARTADIKAQIDTLKKNGGANKDILAKQAELQSLDQQHGNIVEAIRAVLERRINSLGVSEATITPSYFGSEKHLLVECPGVIDVNKCIATVGKTIQLEFKEESSSATADEEKNIRAQADKVYKAVTSGTGNLQVYGQDLSSQLGVSYIDSQPVFVSSLPKGLEALALRKPSDPALKTEATIQTTAQDEQGQNVLKEIKGIYVTKVLEGRKPAERELKDPHLAYAELARTLPSATMVSKSAVDVGTAPAEVQKILTSMAIGSEQVVSLNTTDSAVVYLLGRTEGTEQMQTSHILIQYKGADRADATVTRTREQAQTLANQIKQRLSAGENFNTIASRESDGPSKGKAGSLGTVTRGMMVQPFEEAAFALQKGQISQVVETPFGFHIIRADTAPAVSGTKVTYDILTVKGDLAVAQKVMDQVEKGEVKKTEDQVVVRSLFFSLEPTGWKDTTLNGLRFRAASVTADPVTNIPVVQIQFDEEGAKIFQELTKRNIGKRIAIFVGGQMVSAPTVQNEISGGNAVITGSGNFEEAQALAQDLNTGAIPAPIYLAGQTTVEATLGNSALQQSVVAAAVGLLILGIMMILIYRLLGVLACISLALYVVLLLASTKLPLLLITKEHVVLTLAGIAGMILSMGMAVDANVLAFERIKEELRRGKMLKTAVEVGFRKAWPSVRDGNTSTLITCAILFTIGTSIIRGFAITLAIGIFISLFTAIVVTRWLCRKLADSPLADRTELFGVKREHTTKPTILE